MRIFFLVAAAALFSACSNSDTTSGGTPMDSAQAAQKDSLANITQPTPTNLDTSVQHFLAFNKAMQFDSAANYVYPAVYKYLPKSQVIQGLSILKVLEGIEIKVDSANVLHRDSIVKFSSGEAAKLDYALKLNVTIQDTGVGKQVTPQMRNMIIGALKSGLGAENVAYNDATRTIGATIKRQALAISDTSSKGWKFIALENNDQLRQIIPAEIANRYLGSTQSTLPRDSMKKDSAIKPLEN